MSETVSQALYLTGGSAASETAMFISKIDKFFDCLNVSSPVKGKLTRKPSTGAKMIFALRYHDYMACNLNKLFLKILQFLTKEFLPHLQQWKESVEKREGYSTAAKKRMMLSQETLDGIHITSKLK